MSEILKISSLGNQGDGIANGAKGQIFVPFTLEGEGVEVSGSGAKRELERVVDPSPDRVDPFCKHYGSCGSCQLQHVEHGAYLKWKTEILKTTLSMEGIEFEVEPIRHYPRANRRRAVFTGIKTTNGMLLGFSERGSNKIVGLKECPVLVPELVEVFPQIRELCHIFAPRNGIVKASVVVCDNGFDIAINNGQKAENKQVRDAIDHVAMQSFLRFSINGETVYERIKPTLQAGIANVAPAPEAFVQASKEAEEEMAALVTKHLKSCKKVVDLFSGFGPFALRLAQKSEVIASESNQAALDALDRAWRDTGGKLKKVTCEKRDLFRRPFAFQELKYIDGVVLDPPRAGAEFQCEHIAKSRVKKVAAVSCNPTTLARDLKILINGGFKIKSITPFDQFSYTPHLETVVLLAR